MIEEIKQKLLSGKEIEEVLKEYDWKFFENFVKEILEAHSFKTKLHLRFKTRRRYEIDILAERGNLLLAIDCKMLGRGRYKKTEIEKAILLQEERIRKFKKFSKIKSKKLYSIIVTLFEEEILQKSKTFVIPIWKFNSFISNLDYYLSFSKNL
ncbi:MAG: hypothetical protein QXP77_01325 [Candidatus Aenigmatarchaeota archaeon]